MNMNGLVEKDVLRELGKTATWGAGGNQCFFHARQPSRSFMKKTTNTSANG